MNYLIRYSYDNKSWHVNSVLIDATEECKERVRTLLEDTRLIKHVRVSSISIHEIIRYSLTLKEEPS